MLKARSDWLVKLLMSFAIYLPATRGKMAANLTLLAGQGVTFLLQISRSFDPVMYHATFWAAFCLCTRENIPIVAGIYELKPIFCGVYYLIILEYTKTNIHLSVGWLAVDI